MRRCVWRVNKGESNNVCRRLLSGQWGAAYENGFKQLVKILRQIPEIIAIIILSYDAYAVCYTFEIHRHQLFATLECVYTHFRHVFRYRNAYQSLAVLERAGLNPRFSFAQPPNAY